MLQRQAVTPQVLLGDLNTDLKGADAVELDLVDRFLLNQLVAYLLGDLVQGTFAGIAEKYDGEAAFPAAVSTRRSDSSAEREKTPPAQ